MRMLISMRLPIDHMPASAGGHLDKTRYFLFFSIA